MRKIKALKNDENVKKGTCKIRKAKKESKDEAVVVEKCT